MADVQLTITIPDVHTTRVLDAFTKAAGARIELMAHKHTENNDFNANWSFEYAEQDTAGGETAKQFGARVILELTKALVKMVDYAEDQARYRTEVSAITPAAQDVPEDVITGV